MDFSTLLSNIFSWATNHASFGGLLLVAGLVWRIIRFLTRLEDKFKLSFEHVEKMATNEFPHMQAALESLAENFKGIREDLQKYVYTARVICPLNRQDPLE